MVYVLLTCSGHRSLPVVCYMYAHGIYALCIHSTIFTQCAHPAHMRMICTIYMQQSCNWHTCVAHAFRISVRAYNDNTRIMINTHAHVVSR